MYRLSILALCNSSALWPSSHYFQRCNFPVAGYSAVTPWRVTESMCGLHAKINSYLDFRVYFACYPPESFKLICFTCIWSKFVDTSFHSSQNPQQNPCHISQFSSNRGVKLITHRGLGLAKSTPNLAIGSNAKLDGAGGGARNRSPAPLVVLTLMQNGSPISMILRKNRGLWTVF